MSKENKELEQWIKDMKQKHKGVTIQITFGRRKFNYFNCNNLGIYFRFLWIQAGIYYWNKNTCEIDPKYHHIIGHKGKKIN